MGIEANEKIAEVIRSKYGSLSDENIKRYFLEDFYISSSGYPVTEEMYPKLKEELDRVISSQNLSMEDVTFLGAGQTFSGIGVGDLVIKLGSKMAPVYDLPYRLTPIHEDVLSDRVSLFVSQRADTKSVTEKDVQEMYNYIRDTGGIWLDVKKENLGRMSGKVPEGYLLSIGKESESIPKTDSFGVDLPKYQGDVFLIDYEDVVYLTPKIRDQIVKYEPVNINSIKREVVKDNTDVDEMYYQGYVVNSNRLLAYEERYQRQKGDISKADRCKARAKENERNLAQREYEMEQVYRQGRRMGTIGKKYSVKEIGIRAMQKTSYSRIKEIAGTVKYRLRDLFNRRCNKKQEGIFVEEVEIGEDFEGYLDNVPEELDPYATR